MGYQPSAPERLRRWVLAHPTLVFLSGVGLFTLLIEVGAIAHALAANASTLATIVTALLVLIPALTTAIHLVNWLVTHTLPPRVLPKLDLEAGIPVECRTMVVVPALLGNAGDVESLFTQLELHYLRNPDPRLTFALLSDFTDAHQADLPEDVALLDQAHAAVAALNQKYAHQPFYFFHRRRLWNQSEECWMGWERKRGKLHEFNQLLRHAQTTSFFVQEGKLDLLPAVRYVITLDADTVLPRDAAHRLVGTLSHPLNQARFAPGSNRVSAGYTILQPRTAIKPVSANQSLFTRIFAGEGGSGPLHIGRFRRLSGSVWGWHLCGQGHLRCRCLRAQPDWTDSRKYVAQPRSFRRRPWPRWASLGHCALRRVSAALFGQRVAFTPLDPR